MVAIGSVRPAARCSASSTASAPGGSPVASGRTSRSTSRRGRRRGRPSRCAGAPVPRRAPTTSRPQVARGVERRDERLRAGALLDPDGQRLGCPGAEGDAERERQQDGKHEDPEHRLGLAQQLAQLDQDELPQWIEAHRDQPHSSRRWRPVSDTNTSSSVAWCVARRRRSTPLATELGEQRRERAVHRGDGQPHRPSSSTTPRTPASAAQARSRSTGPRRRELDDVLGAERGDQLARACLAR